jgi:hypothetical protein
VLSRILDFRFWIVDCVPSILSRAKGPYRRILVAILLLFVAGPLHAQARLDIRDGALEWYWSPDPAAPMADGFNVKCGPEPGKYSVINPVAIADAPYNPRVMALKTAVGTAGLWFCVVTAFNAAGEGSSTNEIGFTLLPAAPSGLSAVALSSSSILLTWSNNETGQPQSINVDRKYQVAGAWLALTLFGLKNNFINTNLKPNTVYCYRIKTVILGLVSLYSTEACARTAS